MEAQGESQRRRWPRRLVAAFVVLFVVFHLAGGWYFASEIRADALLVEEQAFDLTIPVLARGESTITLAFADADDDLASSEVLGVAYSGGYGQVGEVVGESADSITRAYTQLSGEPPDVGALVELEGFAYPADPGVLGLAYTEVTYTAAFGEFPAWLVDGTEDTWAILVHGRGSHMREGLRILPTLAAAGMPALLIGYRNDEAAPATADRLARFGVTEWEDLEGAVEYAISHGAAEVVLVGFSMGGAMSMAFLERSPQARVAAAVIFDSPALDLAGMVESRAADTDIVPGVPIKVPPTLTIAAKAFADVRFDVSWWLLDYLRRPNVITVPALLIHGDEDDSVPVGQSIELAEALGDLARLEVFPGAGHVRSWNVDPARYEQVVAEFLMGVLESGE